MARKNIKMWCSINKSSGFGTWDAVNSNFKQYYGVSMQECGNALVKFFGKQLLLKPIVVHINMFCGYSNKFYFKICDKYDPNDKKKCRVLIGGYAEYKSGNVFNVENLEYTNITSDVFTKEYANEIIDGIKSGIYIDHVKAAGLNPDGQNTVQLDVYRDYKNTGEKSTLTGSVFEIFDSFTTANDRLKYINGSYYKFTDKNVENLYHEFLNNYKGNFFLDNAVRRGCIID